MLRRLSAALLSLAACLPCGVNAHAVHGQPLLDVARPVHQKLHGLVPAGGHELSVFPDEGLSEAICAVVGHPAVQPLGPESASVDAVVLAASDADDAAVLHSDVQAAAVAAHDAGRLHPVVWLGCHARVHAHGPVAAVWSARAEDIGDRVAALVARCLIDDVRMGGGRHDGQRGGEERMEDMPSQGQTSCSPHS